MLAGCKSGPDEFEQFRSNVYSRPIPQNEQDKRQECASIRAEMARVRGYAAIGATSSGIWPAIHAAQAERVMAVWESRAADVGCSAAFTTAPAQKDAMTSCMDACETRARKSGSECFDLCRQK